eukprot:GILJ01009576.1.p1 GENE.GILJ01009576.1~~GILJ01009576.1.p1  ORF type:complete len:128 (+),score=1.48 GILJ01009576.1:3-386(+)
MSKFIRLFRMSNEVQNGPYSMFAPLDWTFPGSQNIHNADTPSLESAGFVRQGGGRRGGVSGYRVAGPRPCRSARQLECMHHRVYTYYQQAPHVREQESNTNNCSASVSLTSGSPPVPTPVLVSPRGG